MTRSRVSPRQLVAINIACAGVGLFQGVYVAREVGATGLAVIGVLAGSSSVVANFVDVRSTDLAAKLFYATDDGDERAALLDACVLLNVVIGAVLLLLGAVVGVVVAPRVLSSDVALGLVLAQSASTAAGLVSGTPIALLRMSERLDVIAAWRIAAQLLTTAAVVTAVTIDGDAGGYYVGAAGAAIALVPASLIVGGRAWRGVGVPVGRSTDVGRAWRTYRQNARFLLGTNAMGYGKMLHRSADVLVVAAVASDTATGVYRFARSLTDGLYVVFDAISQVLFPRFLSLLAAGRRAELRAEARRLLLGAIAFVAVVELLVLVGLPVVERTVLDDSYPGLVLPVALLVLPFLVVTGVHLRVWSSLVHHDRISLFVAPSLAAAALQIVVIFVIDRITGATAGWAAAAYAGYYVCAYAPAVLSLKRLEGGEPAS